MISCRFKQILLLFFIACLIISGCDLNEKKGSGISGSQNSEGKRMNRTDSTFVCADSSTVIVVPCANGYEYAMHNYDFNPVIENELNKFQNIHALPFPFKKLTGVSYQGVFDKKYCLPIIQKVNVDYLILTRFSQPYNGLDQSRMEWGYQLKIINTKTLEELNSLSAKNLKDYNLIEKHIRANIGTLKNDIEKLR